ncbi:carboxypeptidase D [Exophiala aquamarina CBS 119918]|uniref:Carboxypeptidase D n=1 Tax=Exophiala aquamarina CBS 119918 TaxID=1182545 RepID=A0A072PGX1_9EURO|nr:carboxypeptidase D [Exophiala aquamarina CBS 119918]KEF59349.1 carboxypeptidase D [Exophiala aquamarina CBS 119918]
MLRHWNQGCIFVAFLVGVVSSHRRDVAARRGFTPQAIEEMKARSLHGRRVEAPEKRYYTNDTKGYFVESLPDIPQEFMTEMYSGVINLNKSDDNRGLFFVFQPRVGTPVDEITVWFNGGPGNEKNKL